MRDVTFDNLRWLHLLWVALLVVVVGVYGVWQRRRAARLFASPRLLGAIAPPLGWTRPLVRLGLVALALACLVAALVGPRWGEVQETVVRRGVDIMVALDVSRSMLARDLAPNRLERAKIAIREDLLPVLAGDRIGLIAFAGTASLKCPLTRDYGFFRLALDDLSTRSVARGGTFIGDALRKAGDAFDDIDHYKIVVLITDGEDHESYPVEAARGLWEEHRIPVVAIGLGDPIEGARIPVQTRDGTSYMEHGGQTVWTRADFDQLRAIAEVPDLEQFTPFIPVGTKNFDLGEIYRRIVSAVEYQRERGVETVRQPAQYHWFALAALLLLLVDSAMRDGPRRATRDVVLSVHRRGAAA